MPNEYLTTIDEGRRRVQRGKAERTGDRIPTDESVGDPDEGTPEAAGQAGAATGAILGTTIAGPIGMVAGAGLGAAAEAAVEGEADGPAIDDDRKADQLEEWDQSQRGKDQRQRGSEDRS
jgi:hypothetical protein